MSSLWTPGGEHPVDRRATAPPPPAGESAAEKASAGTTSPGAKAASRVPGAEAAAAQPPTEAELEALRRQLAQTPAAVVVANHVIGLYELAAVHLSLTPPQLTEASVAIDAMGALVEGLAGRLGEGEQTLRELLAQIRLAFVQFKTAAGPAGT